MWRWRYVSGRQLHGFRHYKYSAVDTNPLSVYIMQPIWNKIIKIVPLWIAPNLLTFSGFVMILFNYFLISFYDWDYTASGTSPGLVPTWVWLFSAFTTFCAYALDSIDGKHARRTQSSTPLGELFDHGLDSWATSIFVLSFFSVCSRDNGKTGVSVYTMYIYLSIVLFNFMCSHWEKYNTGVLFLPWGYDISQVVLIAAYLLTGTVGVEVWQKPLLFGYYITDVLVILLIAQFEINAMCTSLDIENKCKVIICQMSSTRPELFHWFLFPLALVVYAAISGLLGCMEEAALGVFTALLTAAHVHYGVCVGRQLSEHLNIYIFSLKKRVQE
ncbi:hypothetical protein DUI87_07628 [Hirundo rustica rustica]|uniref:Ethanolaminephosphotransferase 1 n=1 Tax=Hirundo rustica rustica TaxID=333673 RepID=A0A3M0L883_HIRRU|nr:hypothetical protein DUI87_07628 [Hirundo rustica rustica]